MKIHHIPFSPDFIAPIIDRQKKVTFRPLKPQPTLIDSNKLRFGSGMNESEFYIEDYPCPFGSDGNMLMMHCEGNNQCFFETKIVETAILRLYDAITNNLKITGFETFNDYIMVWDGIYSETEFESKFNPAVWVIRWN